MPGFGVGGGGCRGHNGVDDAQGDGLLPLKWGISDPVSFELLGELLVQAEVILGVRGVSGVGESIEEMVCCNLPPCLRNRFFPKSVHSALGVLGMTYSVPVNLEEFDMRDG